MKKLLFILFTLISFSAFSQVKVGSAGDIVPLGNYPAVMAVNVGGLHDSLALKADTSIIVSNYAAAQTAATGGKRKIIYVLTDPNYYLNGIYIWSGSVLRKQADEPLLENAQQLMDMHKQLDAFVASPSNSYIAWANYGDSVSPDMLEALFRLLGKHMSRGALTFPAAMNASLVLTTTGTISYIGANINSPTPGVLAGDGTANVSDFTYLGSSNHVTMADGSTITLSGGQATEFSQIRVNLAKGPGMGSATIELFSLGTTTPALQTATVNLSNASLDVSETDFTVAKTGKYDVRITASGKVVHLLTAFMYSNGYIPCEWNSRGGSDYVQNNYANATIRNYLANEFNISLWIMMAKERYTVLNTAQPTIDTLKAIPTPHSIIAFSSFPDVSNDSTQRADNEYLRQTALVNGIAYGDNFKVGGSEAALVSIGWQGDGTHVSDPLKDHAAALWYSKMGLDAYKPYILSQINHDHTSNYVATNKVSIFQGDNSGTEIPIIETYGGGAPTFGIVENLAQAFFGTKNSSAYLAGYASGIAVRDASNNFGILNAGTITQNGSTNISSFAGKTVFANGIDINPVTIAAYPASQNLYNIRFVSDGKNSNEANATATGVFVKNSSGNVARRISDNTPASELPIVSYGSGSPYGVVSSIGGKLYIRTDGTSSTTVYFRAGTSNNSNWDSVTIGGATLQQVLTANNTATLGANFGDNLSVSGANKNINIANTNNNTTAYLGTFSSGTGGAGGADQVQLSMNRNPATGAISNSARTTANLTVYADASDAHIGFYVSALPNTAPTEQMRITNYGSIGIGTSSPITNAILDLTSTTKAFLPPRMNTTQRNAIGGSTAGLVIYNSDMSRLNFYDGSTWGYSPITSSGTAAPTTTPKAVGDEYIDTTNKKAYKATGTSSSADWTILN